MFCFDSIMIQFKKKSSKSVIVLLIFLTTTTHGLIKNSQPLASRSADRRYRISFDRRRVETNLPENRNLARQIDQKDAVYENLYDRRSFRTGPHEIRSSKVNERIRLVDRHPFRNDARNALEGRYVRDTRNTDTFRNRNFRVDLSRSDSVRQFRNARVNFERILSDDQGIRGVRYTSRNSQIREVSMRTDSTRYLRNDQNKITRERPLGSARRQYSGRPEQRRNSERMSRKIRLEHEQASTVQPKENSREFRARSILIDETRRRILLRTSVQGSTDFRRINMRYRQVEKIESPVDTMIYNKAGRYIIPERRVTSFNSTRSGEHAWQVGRPLEILEENRIDSLRSMYLKKTLSENSWVNVTQTVLAIYMIWQILAKSSQKSNFRFHNMFSAKEKLH